MQYILVELDSGAQVLQCISGGIVQGYRSPIDGATVTVMGGSRVIDANPAKPSWDAPDPEPPPPPRQFREGSPNWPLWADSETTSQRF